MGPLPTANVELNLTEFTELERKPQGNRAQDCGEQDDLERKKKKRVGENRNDVNAPTFRKDQQVCRGS